MSCSSGCCGGQRPPDQASNDATEQVSALQSGGSEELGNDESTQVVDGGDKCCSGEPATVQPEVAAAAQVSGCRDGCCTGADSEPASLTDGKIESERTQAVGDTACDDDCCAAGAASKVVTGPVSGCNEGCCGSDVRVSNAIEKDNMEVKEKKACEDECCGNTAVDSTNSVGSEGARDCCASAGINENDEAIASGVASTCCSGLLQSTNVDSSVRKQDTDDCCGVNKQAVNVSIASACTSEEKDCCPEIKPGCCDDSCIDRLAERECIKNESCKKRDRDHTSRSSANSVECCPNGISTRKFYRDLLKSLGCLCRVVKQKGEPSCCVPKRQEPAAQTRMTENEACAKTSSYSTKTGRTRMRFGRPEAGRIKRQAVMHGENVPTAGSAAQNDDVDLEPGFSDYVHVTLSVSGMTCSGCEVKLQRSFSSIKSIKNVRTSLIMCRAEFDLDSRLGSIASIIHQMERMTEFKIEEIRTDGGVEIEVVPTNIEAFLTETIPNGVVSLEAKNKTTVGITYDPKDIGARDLVEHGFSVPLQLASLKVDAGIAAGGKHVRHVGWMTLFSAVLTVPVLILAWAPLPDRPVVYGSISLALASLVQFVVAGPFYPAALKALFINRLIEMDLLIVISTSAAYIYSVVAFSYLASGQALSTGEFFETSTLLVTLIMVGRFVSALARHEAVKSVSVRSLQTNTAIIVDEANSLGREIDARLLQYGDIFRVSPESRIPTDGTVISGSSEVDESMITGESLPVAKNLGSTVIAGSINGPGMLSVRLSRLPNDNTISAIASMVDEAKLSKPKIQEVADKVASYFVPIAIAMGLVTFLIWIPVGVHVRDYRGSEAVVNALTYGITVIVVSCPCAIGLAVPMVIMIASGVAAKNGCIFRDALSIEVAKRTSHIVFDKTGTLTKGQLMVTDSKIFAQDRFYTETEVISMISSLLLDIKHPVAVAVRNHLQSRNPSRLSTLDIKTLAGKGVEGTINGRTVKAGNSRWLNLTNHPDVQDSLSLGQTTFCVTIDTDLCAIFSLSDSLRPDTLSTIRTLQSRNIQVSLLSGDDDAPVASLASRLNISTYQSRCTPAAKAAYMKSINPHGTLTTIFCGDGTNDAVALAQATIGVHISTGTDVARSAADVILTRSSIADILTLLDLSHAAMRRVKFNFAWAFVYNTLAILLASGALVGVRIPPAFAGLGEMVSVLPVLGIAVSLRWWRRKEDVGCAASEAT